MNQTTNFGLNQWSSTDRIQMEDFNADTAQIDAALAGAGNCKVVTGSYVGTGTHGSSNRNTLTFDGTPILVIVAGSRGFTALQGATGTASLSAGGGEPYGVSLVWGTNSLSWYAGNNADLQCNTSGATYYYCALFATA